MKLESKLYVVGRCRQLHAVSYRGGDWRMVDFPAICALIRHPTFGDIVFDTGYSRRFFEATSAFPYSLYGRVTPVSLKPGESLAEQLAADGVGDVAHVILSHLHADHVAGLRDFPRSRIMCRRDVHDRLKHLSGFKALRKAFLPDLMPLDFESRAVDIRDAARIPLPRAMAEFGSGYDLFGDGSVVAVDVDGHTRQQIGVHFDDIDHGPTFLCADAAWSSRAVRDDVGPNFLGYLPVEDRAAHDATLSRLHRLHKSGEKVRIVPSHCPEVALTVEGSRNV